MPAPRTGSDAFGPMSRRRRFVGGEEPLGGPIFQGLADLNKQLLDVATSARGRQLSRDEALRGQTEAIAAANKGEAPPVVVDESTVGGEAYAKGSEIGYLAAAGNNLRLAVAEAQSMHETDPEGFDKAVEKIRGGYKNLPAHLAANVGLELDALAGQGRLDIQKTIDRREKEANEASVRGYLSELAGEEQSAVFAGDTARAQMIAAKREAVIDQSIKDGLLAGGEAAAIRESIADESRQAQIIGGVMRSLDTQGIGAARAMAEKLRRENVPGMSPKERMAAYRQVDSIISEREMVARQAAAIAKAEAADARREYMTELRGRAKLQSDLLSKGVNVPGLDKTMAELRGAGEDDTADALQRASDAIPLAQSYRGMAPRDLIGIAEELSSEAGRDEDPESALWSVAKAGLAVETAKATADAFAKGNGLKWAEEAGMVEPTSADDPVARTAAVRVTENTYGMPVPMFQPAEVDAIVKAHNEAPDAETRLAIATQAMTRWPDDESKAKASKQLVDAGIPQVAIDLADSMDDRLPPRAAAEAYGKFLLPEPKQNEMGDTKWSEVNEAAAEVLADGGSAILGASQRTTNGAEYTELARRHLAQVRHLIATDVIAGVPIGDAKAKAKQVVFGDDARNFDEEDLAQVQLPTSAIPFRDTIRRGFEVLRADAAASRPVPPGLSPFDAARFENQREALADIGQFVNHRDGFALIEPGYNAPVPDPKDPSKPRVFTLDEVMAAGRAAETVDPMQQIEGIQIP